jgi:hypothetical protein
MISINELRVGSWYKNQSNDENLRYAKVQYGSDIDYVAVYGEPIPLSPDLLIALGFEFEVYGHNGDRDVSSCEICRGISINDEMMVWVNGTEIQHIKHLHQLQNLVFFTTNEELPIDIEKIKNVLK